MQRSQTKDNLKVQQGYRLKGPLHKLVFPLTTLGLIWLPEKIPGPAWLMIMVTFGYRKERCCYITVDSAMASSQNGFCPYKLSIHRENQYYADYDKKYYNFYFFNLLSKRNCDTSHFVTLSLSYANTVL